MLIPVREDKKLPVTHFPTDFQTLIFRLWEMVPAERLAEVIKTDVKTVKALAADMGLGEQTHLEKWMTRGYISILRNVWNVLPYEQIYQLLDWTEERLDYVLKEDDFLAVKLGGWGKNKYKFNCEPVIYRPLTDAEKEMTQKIKSTMVNDILPLEAKGIEPPFDFFNDRYNPITSKKTFDVTLDSNWGLVVNGDSDAKEFAQDFLNEIKSVYGVKLQNGAKKNISIDVCIDSEDEEYHEIDICDEGIEIRTATSVGVLRALNFLLDLAVSAGNLSFKKKSYKRRARFKTRFIYSFCGLYGDVLDKDSQISFPDQLLKEYARCGVNGVWIQGIFFTIAPYPFKKGKDEGWEQRLENLRLLTERLARYGIKVYVYINEPRQLEIEEFEKFPHLKGRIYMGGRACLCSSHPEVHQYLKDTIKLICKSVPKLGGFFNITQSENNVTCMASLPNPEKPVEVTDGINPGMCPVCGKRLPSEVTADIIRAMAEAIEEVNPDIKFFAYSWGWPDFGEDLNNLLSNLPKNVIVLSVSETKMPVVRGGIESVEKDYSLSLIGPGEESKGLWAKARGYGLECAAKIQVNNSWECSTAPFLPVFENVIQHMRNLTQAEVEHVMLSWTLGGYVSDNIKMASSYFFEDCESENKDPYDEILHTTYGEYADKVKMAVSHFCKGFSEFPFSVLSMYHGPANAGASNLLYPEKTNLSATMTCYPYDDLKGWRDIYPEEVYLNQFEKICAEWEEGLKCLEGMPLCEFYDMAVYGYTLFKASVNQIRYYMLRDNGGSKEEMDKIVQSEKQLALAAYEIMLRNSAVGYEAANHYYVSRSTLREKIVECDRLLDR